MPDYNTYLFSLINSISGQSDFLDTIIVFFAHYLAYVLIFTFIILIFFSSALYKSKIHLFLSALIGFAFGRGVVVELFRFLYHHPRPSIILSNVHPLLVETSYSFPSGHTTAFFTLSFVMWNYNKSLGIVFFIFSTIMGIARIAAGIHYPLDIMAGAIIGLLIGFATTRIVNVFMNKYTKI
ncbi:MAG: phosphatase PAP2 family protein [Candidatus Taylorbacteria bacterium]|nr:phosphatase PAP2 family protein [Candidatus Taylorbacteria bacterium]